MFDNFKLFSWKIKVKIFELIMSRAWDEQLKLLYGNYIEFGRNEGKNTIAKVYGRKI